MRRFAYVLAPLLIINSALADDRQDCTKLTGDGAIAACSAAIRDDPRAAYAYINRGDAYYRKRE